MKDYKQHPLWEHLDESSATELRDSYEVVCWQYAHRFCQMYDIEIDDCFWADEVGGIFLTDEVLNFVVDMTEMKILVENNVPYETFSEWQEYNTEHTNNTINLRSWLMGYRNN
jgi:hypothetical protein